MRSGGASLTPTPGFDNGIHRSHLHQFSRSRFFLLKPFCDLCRGVFCRLLVSYYFICFVVYFWHLSERRSQLVDQMRRPLFSHRRCRVPPTFISETTQQDQPLCFECTDFFVADLEARLKAAQGRPLSPVPSGSESPCNPPPHPITKRTRSNIPPLGSTWPSIWTATLGGPLFGHSFQPN